MSHSRPTRVMEGKAAPPTDGSATNGPASHRIFAAILILGAYSQIVQAILVREGLVVFYGNEVSLGAFFGSWLFWIAVGSVSVLRLRDHPFVRHPLPWLRRALLLLPLLLLLQILFLRQVRPLLNVSSSEFVPLGELFFALFLITIPSSLLLGLAFPLACKALRDRSSKLKTGTAVGDVSRLYVADALGALLGGVLFTFVLIQWVGLAGSLGLIILLLSVTAWSLAADGHIDRRLSLLLGLSGILIMLPPISHRLDRQLEELRFANLQPGMELLDSVETRYGHLAVARLGEQLSIVADGQITDSFPQTEQAQQEAAYFLSQAAGARRLLMFGGYAGDLLAELLRYPVERIDLVVEDRRAYEHLRPYLPEKNLRALNDPRLQLHFLDGRRYLNRLTPSQRFDLALVLDATPASAYSNRYFTAEFYLQIRNHLSSEGVFCTQVSSASNYLGRTVRSFAGSVFHTLEEILPDIAIMPGDVHVYCATASPGRVTEQPAELRRRYLDTPLDEHAFPADSFQSLLPAEDIRYVRDRLQQGGAELNSDDRPVTYYLNMILWSRFSASGFADWLENLRGLGPWPYLLPSLLFVPLWLLHSALHGFNRPRLLRGSSTLALFTLGLIAMAAQLVVLFSYQAHVGFMFGRVALINGLFMTGLALGAGLGQRLARSRWPALALAGVLLLCASGLALMPSLLGMLGEAVTVWQEPGYLILSLLLGLSAGTGFPLGVQLIQLEQAQVVRSSGMAGAADNLGGAVGGILTGTLMVPILGVDWTCQLLALFALLALLPLLFAQFSPRSFRVLAERGHSTFPWPGLGWVLTFVVLLTFAWHLLQRGNEPGPQLRFGDQQLSAISGSTVFKLKQSPFDYYLGAGADQPATATVALSSMAAAPEVRGYAGPINLLLALDEQGLLRGVSYIDSAETPSYIAGIDQWLADLQGRDLSTASLSLDNIDALSGATVSSQAALEAINRSARAAGQTEFERIFAPEPKGKGNESPAAWRSLKFLVTLALLLGFFPVYLSGSEGGRLAYQGASLLILGIWFNTLVTEIDLLNLGLGHWPSLTENPQRWLLIGFVLVTGLLFGQVWCGYVCPFGALQEFVSRAGHRLGLRSYPDRHLETRVRFLKFLLLALLLTAVWASGDLFWGLFNPMQHAFRLPWRGWMVGILLAVLVGALLYYRFWCRYFCPFGAFLALSNKLALLQKLAPERRYQHCDLGVKEAFDIDCIHCNRCLSGKDTRIRPHPQSQTEADEPQTPRSV